MNITEIKKALDELTADVTAITDPRASAAVKTLINPTSGFVKKMH